MSAILVLMGVTGAGKTTVGRMLARQLRWPFYDGDDFHPPANVAKMSRGRPLTDADRVNWLNTLATLISSLDEQEQPAVLTCSALKRRYRNRLRRAGQDLRFIYLKGDKELIRQRIQSRSDHFMPPTLLDSQFADLEEPVRALAVDINRPPEMIAAEIMLSFRDGHRPRTRE